MANKITKFLIGTGIAAYLAGATNSTIKINKEISPLRKEFQYKARNYPVKIIKIETDDGTSRLYDYGGVLDYLTKVKRDEYLRKVPGPQIPFDWWVYENKTPGRCLIINLNPFPIVPNFQEKRDEIGELIEKLERENAEKQSKINSYK